MQANAEVDAGRFSEATVTFGSLDALKIKLTSLNSESVPAAASNDVASAIKHPLEPAELVLK